MKYKALIEHYQAQLLAEKDAGRYERGFDGIGKLGRSDTRHMNVTAKRDKNEYRPYNANTKNLSTAANQALMRIDKAGRSTRHFISNDIADEILIHYKKGTVNSLNDELSKSINSKSLISVVKSNGKVYLQKN
jgi:hypothetical protein